MIGQNPGKRPDTMTDKNDKHLANFVGGEFVRTKSHFPNVNPVDGSTVCSVSEADSALVDAAVRAARSALHSEWGKTSTGERSALLHEVANGIEQRFDDFVRAEIADTGKPLSQAQNIDIPRSIANFRFFADMIKTSQDESFSMTTPDGRGALNYTVRKPLGVVGVISPWNLPLLLMTWKVAPALAAGNTVVAKPSEETPSSATLLAEVMADAGIPAGAFNLVHGFGPRSAGEFITTHPGVDAITFTGESATGSAIMKAVADTVKPVSFELGGKNPAIIFADADIDAAISGTARSTFTNCGQVCLCSERVYVERPVFERFVEGLRVQAEGLRPGRPYDENTSIGPLISRKHRDKVLSYYELARSEGATVVCGGGIPQFGDECDNGAFIQPTIWTGLAENSRCALEEIFGPVCHVAPFDTEEEVIAMANASRYGLACALWTGSLQRAHRVAPQIEAGIVWVNTWYLRDLRTPFGGVKLSGIGREGGVFSLGFYSEPTNICIKL
jgi:aminomuconate-semialdehyde/2-hydroxymuconate-6-semialdehyde dehydrogenase